MRKLLAAIASAAVLLLPCQALAQAQAQFSEIKLPFPNFAGSIGQMLRPFPQYNGAGSIWMGPDQWANFGTGSYNSLQTSLSRRMTDGLYFLVAYTWSKTFDDGGHTAPRDL